MDLFKTWLVQTLVAHRGLHNERIPENSLAAFQNAVDKGYNIELDVQLIADGTVVVFHDETLTRMTGKDGALKSLTKADLKTLTLKNSQEKIPTFEEVLNLVAGKTPIIIEIKNKGKVGELEQKVIDLLQNYQGKYAIASFNPKVLAYFKARAPYVLRGQLSGSFKWTKMNFIKKWLLKSMWFAKKDELADFIMYEAGALPSPYIHKLGRLPVLTWTVRTQQEYQRVMRYADNIIFEGFVPKNQ
jgi:glycerophosphoryl diester phosphodiesterase